MGNRYTTRLLSIEPDWRVWPVTKISNLLEGQGTRLYLTCLNSATKLNNEEYTEFAATLICFLAAMSNQDIDEFMQVDFK